MLPVTVGNSSFATTMAEDAEQYIEMGPLHDLPLNDEGGNTSSESPAPKQSFISKLSTLEMIVAVAIIICAGGIIGLGAGFAIAHHKPSGKIEYVPRPRKSQATTYQTPAAVTEKSTKVDSSGQHFVVVLRPWLRQTTTDQTPAAVTEKSTTVDSHDLVHESGPWTDFRLRDTMRPSHYDITLNVKFEENYYRGNIEITFNTSEETEYVIFHAHSTLSIRDGSLKIKRVDTMEKVSIAREFRQPENDFYVVQTESKLSKDTDYVMSMQFTNEYSNRAQGIYKTSYVDPKTGDTKYILASYFLTTNARRGYPCFDEPAMKAEFTTTIIHAVKYSALSNMPVESRKSFSIGKMRTSFQRSPPMSTYLSSFVVGELAYAEAFSGRNISLRIYAAPYLINSGQADMALESTVAMFDKYEELFNMTYPLPKYDQVSLPISDFGAMEQWGLTTCREIYLMWHPRESSTAFKQTVVSVIAHQMVHQWVGNLVTMDWWDGLWLNEGIASYFQYRGMKWANPEWLTQAHHLVEMIQPAMRADQSIGTHPLKTEVNTSEQAQLNSISGKIVYGKGSSILNMLDYTLEGDLFIGGLRLYLKKRQFGVATVQDFWFDMQENIVGKGTSSALAEIMDPWIEQRGYPVVNVTANRTTVVAKQEPAFTDLNMNVATLPDSKYGYKWNIDLNFFTQNALDTIVRRGIRVDDTSTILTVSDYGDWLKVNERGQIFNRVNYDRNIWKAIVRQLSTDLTAFREMDRSNLLDDAFNLVRAKRIDYIQALDLTTYLNNEKSYFVWTAFESGTSYLRAMLESTELYRTFQEYYVTRVKPIADELGWDANVGSHEEKRLRSIALDLAARYGDLDAVNNATRLYKGWKAGEFVHPDVRSVVYMYGIQAGTQDDWWHMMEKYKLAQVDGERHSLLSALASTEDVKLIAELLRLAKKPDFIKEQDFLSCLAYLAGNTLTGNTMTWSWVRGNWDYLVDRFGLDNDGLAQIVPLIVENYNTWIQKWEVESFFDANPDAEFLRAPALAKIDLNIQWMADNEESVGLWLKDASAKVKMRMRRSWFTHAITHPKGHWKPPLRVHDNLRNSS